MNANIEKAAVWLATTPEAQRPHPIVGHLRRTFDLSAAEAVAAIRESHLVQARAT
jgi:hypothetical protein